MSKICVPNVIKGVNMQVYNFLMRLNETCCAKGYTWNPSICECQCDKWCKQGQHLDHKLIGRLIEECTSVINETMINNKDNITNNNIYLILFIIFLIGFIMFLIGFIYYYYRSNANKRKLRDFIYPKIKTSTY